MLIRRLARVAMVSIALVAAGAAYLHLADAGARPVVLAQGVGNFDGPWYFAGDLTSPSLIIQAGTNLQIMNEQGRLASATATINQVRANWGDVVTTGTLTPDQRQINWDNGTFWQRHALIDAAYYGGANVGGFWHSADNAALRTLIVQQPGGQLQLMNEQGSISAGVFTGPNTILARAWEGGVTGSLSPDGNYISWSNGTNWRR